MSGRQRIKRRALIASCGCEVDAALFFGAFGIAMLVFCPVIAIIDNVAGVLAFLVGVVMMGLGEWSERQQAQSRIEEAQRADTDGAEERTDA